MRNFLTPSASAALIVAFGLAGCGDAGAPKDRAAPTTTAATQPMDRQSDGLPELNCPGKPDAALPGPDIVGLKLGMARADALNFARCLDKEAFVSFEGHWLQGLRTQGIKLAPQAFATRVGETAPCKFRSYDDMQKCGPGNRVWNHVAEMITVTSPGVPGREKVMGIWREQHFKPGEMPAAETLLPALVQKYGPPQATQTQPNAWIRLDWLQDASGTPLTPGSRGHGACRGISARAQDGQSWSEACGLTLTAMIVLSRENPLLAKELNIGLVHQQALYALGTSLQAELQAMEQKRRQQEVEQSKSSGANLKL